MYYCIGYPLCTNILGQEPELELGMMLEFQNDLIQLTGRQTTVYGLMFARERHSAKAIEQMEALSYGMGYSELDIQNLTKELIKKKVIFDINTDDEFMDKLGGYRLLRQGTSNYVYEELKKHIFQPCIRIGISEGMISNFELEIWKKCNASKTIKELYNEDFYNSDFYDFVYAIRNLKVKSALYII